MCKYQDNVCCKITNNCLHTFIHYHTLFPFTNNVFVMTVVDLTFGTLRQRGTQWSCCYIVWVVICDGIDSRLNLINIVEIRYMPCYFY